MKKILPFLFILSIFLNFSAFSQKEEEEKGKKKKQSNKRYVTKETLIGDKHFSNGDYYLAAEEYAKAVAGNPNNRYAAYQLGESYRLFFNYKKAEQYYKQAIDPDNEFPLAKYWYATMLKYNGKYGEAEENFQQFLKDSNNSDPVVASYKDKASLDLSGCAFALNELKKPQRDYTFNGLKAPVNTASSDYSPVIYEHDSSIVISSSRIESKGEEQYGALGGDYSDIYRFKKDKSAWKKYDDKDVFSTLQTDRNESPGTFSADKKKFYFTKCDLESKNRNVTEYQCGIYVTKLVNGKWEAPVPLNENINKPGTWNTQPSISPKGDTLFFVSKREGGKGQHDIWYSISAGDDNWGPAINMGDKVNTPYIEVSPCYYSKEKTLFFASNGREGFGGLDIFLAKGSDFSDVRNAGLPFNSNADDFYFVMGEKVGYLSSNREGGLGNDDIYKFNVESKELLIASIDKDSLKEAKSISIEGTILHEETKKGAADLEILLTDKGSKSIKSTKTDEQGDFRFDNLPANDYKVVMKDKDPKLTAEVKYIADKVDVKSSQQVASKKLFENIYFDFDKHTLRAEARKTLDDLVAFYKKHPEIQIEMNANTDSYGSDNYNINLSKSRGKAALDYLISQGVKKTALVVTANGEGKPLASNEDAAGRQLNRRTEFYILGGPGYEAKAMAYIIEPKVTLYSIAKKFNMTVDELKALNGLDGNDIEAYRPLRVRRTTGDNDIIAPVTLAKVDTKNKRRIEYNGSESVAKAVNAAVTSYSEGVIVKKKRESERERRRREEENELALKKIEKAKAAEEAEPLKEGEEYYVVEPLNTIYSIARDFGMTTEEVKKLNNLKTNRLQIGQKLKVIRRK